MRSLPLDDPDYYLTLTDQPQREARDQLIGQIASYNDAHSPHLQRSRLQPPTMLELFLHEQSGSIVGGLLARTYWQWLDIEYLWVSEELRNRGYGRRLMQEAEAEAQRRGCRAAQVTTFSFQAPGFYQKLGFRVIGQIDDYPPGEAFFWLRKDYPPQTEQAVAD